jgi:saccharopine dehydrogenase-like NADP-dependent oxidoreductase
VSVLIGFGDVPGLINIVAKMGALKLDEVEEIHMAAGGNNVRFLAPAMERLWQNVWSDPYVYQDGKYVPVPACSGRESIPLPGVDEELPVMASVNLPLVTLPRFFPGVKLVTFKTGIGPAESGNDLIASLFKWGFNSREPIEVKGVKVAPADFAPAFLGSAAHASAMSIGTRPVVSGYQVRVTGKKNKQAASFTYQFRDTRAAMTQSICVLAAEMLLEGKISQKGILAAEAVEPEPFIQMALKNGIVMREVAEMFL